MIMILMLGWSPRAKTDHSSEQTRSGAGILVNYLFVDLFYLSITSAFIFVKNFLSSLQSQSPPGGNLEDPPHIYR